MNIRQITYGLTALLIVVLIALGYEFFALQGAAKRLAATQQQQVQSYLLAYELRQSSDDLTNMVRSYVATGNEQFEKQYNEIFAIRNGQLERPDSYHRIYWDFLSGGVSAPRPGSGVKKPLHSLMEEAGFSELELDQLAHSVA